jgi:HAD superfamily hydrolase (TIGR01509 family)
MIFDMDGTLVDTVGARIESWLRTLDEEGIPADRDHVAGMIGADGKKLVRDVAERAGHKLDDDDADRLDKRSGENYDELNVDPQPTSGAQSLLVALEHSPLKWAIATSSLAAQTKPSIAALQLPEEPTVVDGSHVEHAKPAPDLLLQAAERLGADPRESWYIGDSTWDMQAAGAAGMVAVGVAYGAADESDLVAAGADAVTTLGEIEADLRGRGLLTQ